MTDRWKKLIEKYESKRQQEQERLWRKIKEEEEAEKQQDPRLIEFKKKFYCHVCKTPSPGPKYHTEWDYADNRREYPEWNNPRGLVRCALCDEWACENHIHMSICQSCGEKM